MKTRLLSIAAAVTLSGCTTENLSESWQLDRLRILAVQAEPAEPAPGELVSFSSLVYAPPGTDLEGVIWFACLPESADEFGCTLDSSLLEDLDPENPDISALVEAGLIGFEPLLAPTWTAPPTALDGLSEIEAQEGVSALVNLTALPTDTEDDGDFELAYKRLPISVALTPNHNPVVSQLLVDGAELVDGTLTTTTGTTHTIEPTLTDDSIEEYTYTTTEGDQEARVEEPYFTWYAEAGTFDQTFSLYPFNDVDWTAPREPFEGTIAVTVRDRRGGMTWTSLRVVVE